MKSNKLGRVYCLRVKIEFRMSTDKMEFLVSALKQICSFYQLEFARLAGTHDIKVKINFILLRNPDNFSVQSSPSPRITISTCTLHVLIYRAGNKRRGTLLSDKSCEPVCWKHDHLSFVLIDFSPVTFNLHEKLF